MNAELLAASLLDWYDREGRSLPWRVRDGGPVDPYAVWLSEIMLQQTTVAAVIPYYRRFLQLWPTVAALAAADSEQVMAAWAGLGYYARARNMLKCAAVIVERHQGRFPDSEQELRRLPGIGDYTAAAIAAIAFGRHAVVVDGNVERVMARLFAETAEMPAVRPQLRQRAASLAPEQRCGDYSQALMDLGATLCTPRNPACGLCPWMGACQGRIAGIESSLPRKAEKGIKPVRHGTAFWIARWDGAVLLRKRPPSGLLGGMMEVPSTTWREDGGPWPEAEAVRQAPLKCDWRPVRGVIRHTFTHFHLELQVITGIAPGSGGNPPASRWVMPEELEAEALPTVMRKIARHAMSHLS